MGQRKQSAARLYCTPGGKPRHVRPPFAAVSFGAGARPTPGLRSGPGRPRATAAVPGVPGSPPDAMTPRAATTAYRQEGKFSGLLRL